MITHTETVCMDGEDFLKRGKDFFFKVETVFSNLSWPSPLAVLLEELMRYGLKITLCSLERCYANLR